MSILLIITLMITLGGCTKVNKDKKSSEDIAEIINTHLEEVYGEKFEVKMMGLIGNSGSPRKVYTADCYPVNNPDLEFEAFYDDGECNDLYMIVRWEYEGEQYFKNYLNELYGQEVPFTIGVNSSREVPPTATFEELMTTYKDKIRLILTCFVFYEEEFDKLEQGKLAYIVANERLKFHDIDSAYMEVMFMKEDKKAETIQKLNEVRHDKNIRSSYSIQLQNDNSTIVLRINSNFDKVGPDSIYDYIDLKE